MIKKIMSIKRYYAQIRGTDKQTKAIDLEDFEGKEKEPIYLSLLVQ